MTGRCLRRQHYGHYGERHRMAEYRVAWVIDIDAGSAQEAALMARAIQLDTESTATLFEVAPWVSEPSGNGPETVDVAGQAPGAAP